MLLAKKSTGRLTKTCWHRSSAPIMLSGKDIFRQERADHVARQYDEFALIVAHNCAYAVTVGVCADYDVRMFLKRSCTVLLAKKSTGRLTKTCWHRCSAPI